jgi:hypothetical protein
MNKLLAPNGKPSNLTPEQYKLVRTPAFKEWFGDWENDPQNASKVVDEETKEPLVVYHGYLVGGGAESNLAALDTLANNPLLPIGSGGIGGAELGSVGSILGTGEGLGQQTLGQVLAPTGLSGVSVQDLASENPVYSSNTNVKDALRVANTLRKLLTPQQQATQRTALQNAQNTQQQSNMANMLRGTQMAQTPLPSIYKQANPFNFGQQNQPVQDTTALANLLRTA